MNVYGVDGRGKEVMVKAIQTFTKDGEKYAVIPCERGLYDTELPMKVVRIWVDSKGEGLAYGHM